MVKQKNHTKRLPLNEIAKGLYYKVNDVIELLEDRELAEKQAKKGCN
jgi:hypothetical protein